jgi:prepilin-type N-terminal cleavage/methylation domain-containing protein
MHHSLNSRRRGFTLMEAVAALVVLSVAFPPMLWAIRRGHAARVTPARFTTARWLAANKIEDIAADRACPTRSYAYLVASNYPAETTITGYPGFTRSVAFTETGPDLVTAGTGYMRATVTVTFTDGMGVSRSYALSSIQTDY